MWYRNSAIGVIGDWRHGLRARWIRRLLIATIRSFYRSTSFRDRDHARSESVRLGPFARANRRNLIQLHGFRSASRRNDWGCPWNGLRVGFKFSVFQEDQVRERQPACISLRFKLNEERKTESPALDRALKVGQRHSASNGLLSSPQQTVTHLRSILLRILGSSMHGNFYGRECLAVA